MDELKSKGKSFEILKREVWEAYLKVKQNRGAAGVDGQSLDDFDADLKGNLYRIWNRMSSGTWFPPPVRAVEIAKPHGSGTRMLGIPTAAVECRCVQSGFGFGSGDPSVSSVVW